MNAGRPFSSAIDTAVLDAALALFAEGGLANVTFDGVAKRAGVSRAAIYRRGQTREAMVANAIGAERDRSDAAFADWKERSYAEVIAWLVENLPRQMLAAKYRALLRHAAALGPDAEELKAVLWKRYFLPRRQAFAEMVAAERSRGGLAGNIDPGLAQDLLLGALTQKLLFDPAALSEADLRALLIDVLKALGLYPAKEAVASIVSPAAPSLGEQPAKPHRRQLSKPS